MKKICVMILTLALLCLTPATWAETAANEDAGLVDKAFQMTQKMAELAGNPTYVQLYSSAAEVAEAAAAIAEGDFTKPDAAHVVIVSDAAVKKLVDTLGMDAADTELYALLKGKMYGAVLNVINGQAGSKQLAVTSALSVGDHFLTDGEIRGVAYVFLDYPGEQMDAATAFSLDDEISSATTNFISWPEMNEFSWSGEEISAMVAQGSGNAFVPDVEDIVCTSYVGDELTALLGA